VGLLYPNSRIWVTWNIYKHTRDLSIISYMFDGNDKRQKVTYKDIESDELSLILPELP
jgi:hypothetical protein